MDMRRDYRLRDCLLACLLACFACSFLFFLRSVSFAFRLARLDFGLNSESSFRLLISTLSMAS